MIVIIKISTSIGRAACLYRNGTGVQKIAVTAVTLRRRDFNGI